MEYNGRLRNSWLNEWWILAFDVIKHGWLEKTELDGHLMGFAMKNHRTKWGICTQPSCCTWALDSIDALRCTQMHSGHLESRGYLLLSRNDWLADPGQRILFDAGVTWLHPTVLDHPVAQHTKEKTQNIEKHSDEDQNTWGIITNIQLWSFKYCSQLGVTVHGFLCQVSTYKNSTSWLFQSYSRRSLCSWGGSCEETCKNRIPQFIAFKSCKEWDSIF